jgi:hypothetical protein
MLSFTLHAETYAPLPSSLIERSVNRCSFDLRPQHWAFKVCVELVERGYIVGRPLFHFSGGLAWKREQMATLLAETTRRMKSEGADPERRTIEQFRRLSKEFAPELRQLNLEMDLSWPELWRMRQQQKELADQRLGEREWTMTGTSTTNVSRDINGSDHKWRESLNLNVRKEAWFWNSSAIVQNVDEDIEPEDREAKLGDSAMISLDQYALSYEREFGEQSRLEVLAGFTGGSHWGSGLVVGNMNLEGFNFIFDVDEDDHVEFVMGRSLRQEDDRVVALHWERQWSEPLAISLQTVGNWYHEQSRSGSLGIDREQLFGLGLHWETEELEAYAEMAQSTEGGWGLFAESIFVLDWIGELRLQGHIHESFDYDYHALEVYGGISGGDDVEETGFSLEVDRPLRETLSLSVLLDSSFNNEEDEELYYAFLEGVWEPGEVDLSLSHELEWDGPHLNQISMLRLSRGFENGLQASLDGSFETVDDEDSLRSRLSYNWDIVREILSFSGSFNYRHSTNSTMSEQFGLNYSLSRQNFLSAQLTLNQPDHDDDTFELNLLMKF